MSVVTLVDDNQVLNTVYRCRFSPLPPSLIKYSIIFFFSFLLSFFIFHSFIIDIGNAYPHIFHLCLLRVRSRSFARFTHYQSIFEGTFDTKSLNYTHLLMPLVGSSFTFTCLLLGRRFLFHSSIQFFTVAVMMWNSKQNLSSLKSSSIRIVL